MWRTLAWVWGSTYSGGVWRAEAALLRPRLPPPDARSDAGAGCLAANATKDDALPLMAAAPYPPAAASRWRQGRCRRVHATSSRGAGARL